MPDASRNLVFRDGSSDKFWTIVRCGCSHTVQFGRVGTDGQTKTKDFSDDAAAEKDFDRLVAQKLKKGYVDAGGSMPAAAAVTASKKMSKKASKKSTTKAAAAAEPIATTTDLGPTEPIVDLSPTERRLPSWHDLGPLDRPEPRPFDVDQTVERMSKLKVSGYGWSVDLAPLDLSMAMGQDEAAFWLGPLTEDRRRIDDKAALATWASKTGERFAKRSDPTIRQTVELVEQIKWGHQRRRDAIAIIVAVLHGPAAVIEVIGRIAETTNDYREARYALGRLALGFAFHVRPYLTEDEVDECRAAVADRIDPAYELDLSDPHTAIEQENLFPPLYYVAASLGMTDAVRAVVSQVPGDYCQGKGDYQVNGPRFDLLLCGLEGPDEYLAEWDRVAAEVIIDVSYNDLYLGLGVPLIAALQAEPEAAADRLAAFVAASGSKPNATETLRLLERLSMPEAAPAMLRCQIDSKASAAAREWIESHTAFCLEGLMATAGGSGSLADAARDYYRGQVRLGQGELVDEAIAAARKRSKTMSSAAAADLLAGIDRVAATMEEAGQTYELFDESTTPAWLAEALVAG